MVGLQRSRKYEPVVAARRIAFFWHFWPPFFACIRGTILFARIFMKRIAFIPVAGLLFLPETLNLAAASDFLQTHFQ
jgi:hypothetical protein